jgi:hypothetical protein
MKQSEWQEQFLEAVYQCSEEGKEAVEYIRAHKTPVSIRRARKSVGAFWSLSRVVYFNSVHFSQETTLANPNAWALLVHEIRHLQQGMLTALSIFGELDAWQYQFQLQKKLTGHQNHPIIEELLSLPLNMQRENLEHARQLMTQFAGKSYGAGLLPLYPIHKEIFYWFTKAKDRLRDLFQN